MPEQPDPDRTERLLEQADALFRRHGPEAARTPPSDDDLPLLTEVVDDVLAATLQPSPEEVEAAVREEHTEDLAERLIALDAVVTREIEAWLASELPQILAGQLNLLAERIRAETIAHMRVTLLPVISDRLAEHLAPPEEQAPENPG